MKKGMICILSVLPLVGLGIGVQQALKSDLFLLKKIEVNYLPAEGSSIIPRPSIASWALIGEIPVGKIRLAEVNFTAIERRLSHLDWVQEVKIQKKFPDTLILTIALRQAKAISPESDGRLRYIDQQGKLFGGINLLTAQDLPWVVGIKDSARLTEAFHLIDQWQNSELHDLALLSSVSWEKERGFRVLMTYTLRAENRKNRVIVDLGQEIDTDWNIRFTHLSSVIQYLGEKSVAAHQISADAAKKIVVKTSQGS